MTTIVRQLGGGYGGTAVLTGIDLEIAPGEVVAILGPSGSGKTTLLRMLAGLHRPSGGQVIVDGADLTAAAPHHRRIGLVPQDGALFPHLSVAGNIGYGIRGLRSRAAARHPRVRELIDLVGLAGLESRMPSQLSGGQRQRVAVARALAPRPQLVLLDEPFSALDADARVRVREAVVDVLRAAEVGALLITHDREEAMSVADRIAVLSHGRILQTDRPTDLFARPNCLRVARATGETIVLACVQTPEGVSTDLGVIPAVGTGEVAVLRPDQLRLVPGDRVVVERRTDVGDSTRVTVRAGATLLTLSLDRLASPIPVGSRWGVELRTPALLLARE